MQTIIKELPEPVRRILDCLPFLEIYKMKDENKTNEQLVNELVELRQRIADLEKSEAERKRMEDELRESEERYKRLVSAITAYTYSVEVSEGRVISTRHSTGCIPVTGYNPEDYEADPYLWYSMIYPDDRVKVENSIKEILEGCNCSPIEHRIIQRDGKVVWVRNTIVPYYNGDGLLIRYDGLIEDITERKQAEEALKKEKAFTEHALNTLKDVFFVFDFEGRLLRWNKALNVITGYSDGEISSMKPIDFFKREDISRVAEAIEKVVKEGYAIVEATGVTKDGRQIPYEFTGTLLNDYKGNPIGISGVGRNITERKQREREMEAIYTLSTALRSAPTRADMLPVILDQLLDLLKAEGALLAMLDPLNDETVIELARGEWDNWTGLRLPPGKGVSGNIISSGQAYLSDDVLSDPHLIRPDLVKDLRAAAGIPLIAKGHTMGALLIGRRNKILKEEVRLLTAIGEIAANAIHRATLHEQTVQHLQRFSALHEIDIAITASLDLRVTLNILLTHVTTQLAVDAAAVLLLNPYTQTLEYAADHGFRSRAIEQTRLKLGEGHAGLAAFERRIVSAVESVDMRARAQILKDDGFISHHVVPLIAKGQVKGVLEIFHRSPLVLYPESIDFLESLAAQAAIAIDNASLFNDLQQSNVELILAYDATIEGWSRALDMRDKETEGHSQRVTEMAVKIAKAMGMSEAELAHVRRGALLHDIGKMGIPDNILLKPGKLTEEEWEIMRKHPVFAYELFSPIAFLRSALDIPYCHHEKWDGTGYPRGLKAEQIPMVARIFAVVDVWDALRSDRPYRPAWSVEKTLEYIRNEAGKSFDPKVVEIFINIK